VAAAVIRAATMQSEARAMRRSRAVIRAATMQSEARAMRRSRAVIPSDEEERRR